MWRWFGTMIGSGCLLCIVGCGGAADGPQTAPEASTQQQGATTQQAASAPVPSTPEGKRAEAADPASPAECVQRFLEAVRTGDDETASSLLTPLARKKTAEMEIVVAPPGSKTASFEVGEVEQVSDDVAHVATEWTDLDESGQPHTDAIVWFLRRLDQGWRVAGMATKVFDDEPPLLLNFEDPADMLRKQQLVEQEIRRRAAAQQQQQQRSQPPATAQSPNGEKPNTLRR